MRHLVGVALFCVLAAVITSDLCALAQGVAAPPPPAQASAKPSATVSSTSNSGSQKTSPGPAWQALTPAQQLSLKPLAANWNALEESKKRKWIAIAGNYPKLAPAEQAKLHSRMTEWVSLSQTQREQARLNFGQSKKLDPGHKAATWQAYQALSPEEKRKLAISAPTKPAGAAPAAKPVSPQKLATVPVIRQTSKVTPKAASSSPDVNRNTLLPQASPVIEPEPMKKN